MPQTSATKLNARIDSSNLTRSTAKVLSDIHGGVQTGYRGYQELSTAELLDAIDENLHQQMAAWACLTVGPATSHAPQARQALLVAGAQATASGVIELCRRYDDPGRLEARFWNSIVATAAERQVQLDAGASLAAPGAALETAVERATTALGALTGAAPDSPLVCVVIAFVAEAVAAGLPAPDSVETVPARARGLIDQTLQDVRGLGQSSVRFPSLCVSSCPEPLWTYAGWSRRLAAALALAPNPGPSARLQTVLLKAAREHASGEAARRLVVTGLLDQPHRFRADICAVRADRLLREAHRQSHGMDRALVGTSQELLTLALLGATILRPRPAGGTWPPGLPDASSRLHASWN